MTLKTLFVTAVLAIAPGLAAAQCSGSHAQQTMSCGEGSQWDGETQTCVPTSTS